MRACDLQVVWATAFGVLEQSATCCSKSIQWVVLLPDQDRMHVSRLLPSHIFIVFSMLHFWPRCSANACALQVIAAIAAGRSRWTMVFF